MSFRLKLFGGASVEGPDGPLRGRAVQRRRLALLALLAAADKRGVSRDKLAAYLWPDADTERGRALLSDSVYRINQALGGEAIVAAGDGLWLDPERLPSDVVEFAAAMEGGAWERAVELHSAPFLDGFFLSDADELERWADVERQRYARERARALEALAEAARDDPAESVRWWRMLAAADPYSSRIALRLMRALEHAGERAAAVQHARIHAVLVRDELGVEPDPEVTELAERLRTAPPATLDEGVSPTAPAEPTAPPSMSVEAPPRPAPRRTRFVLTAATLLMLAAVAIVFIRSPDGGTPAEPTAIAVLPFADLSPGGDQEYFADGITEELTVRLSKVEGLQVVGRTSAFAFKGASGDLRETAERLGVTTVLVGSVRRAGDRLRVVAQLVDAASGYELWSEQYEREEEDVFAIQDEISRAIVTRLRGTLARADAARLTVSSTDDPDAYNLYLRGRFEWHKRTEQGLRNAAELFDEAVSRAPEYARAHAGLGDAYAVLGFYDYLPPGDAFPRAAEAARRALDLDPTLAEAHATLGYVALYHEWDWERAEAEFRQAIELAPSYSTGHQWYANLLTAMGRFDEAAREMRAAQDLDPLSLIANAALGWVLYYARDYERAVDQCSRTLELDPRFELAHLWRGMALEEMGHMDEALASLTRATELSSGSAISRAALARSLAVAGRPDSARTLLGQLVSHGDDRYVPSFEIAKIHEALGERDRALEWLERAYAQRSHSMAFLAVDPQLAGLREHPGYVRLLARVGLDPPPTRPQG